MLGNAGNSTRASFSLDGLGGPGFFARQAEPMSLAATTVARAQQLQAEDLGQREAARQLKAEGYRISRTSVQAIFTGKRQVSQPKGESHQGPKEVAPYRCPGCKNRVWLVPCQICRAREYTTRRLGVETLIDSREFCDDPGGAS